MPTFDTFADAQDFGALAPLAVDGNEIKSAMIIPNIIRGLASGSSAPGASQYFNDSICVFRE